MAQTRMELQERLKTVLVDTAKELGIRVETDTALSKIGERLPRTVKKMIQRADATELLGNNTLADCSVRVCISGAGSRKDGSLSYEKQSCGQSPPRRALEGGPVGASGLDDPCEEVEEHRASKRPRINDGGPDVGQDMTGIATTRQVSATGIVRTIHAHSVILVIHSKYFKASLTGEWRDGSRRVIDVQVSCEQEFEDLELLIKLAYGPSYVMLNSRPLEKDVLLRLLPLADSFEFLGFLDACIDSLSEDLTAEETYHCLQAIPPSLQADERLGEFFKDAANVVADNLGYLNELFEEGPLTHSHTPHGKLSLTVAAQALPPFFLEHLMASEGLKVRSENDTFALAMACLDYHVQHGALTETEAQAFSNRILPKLRYHQMSLHFWGSVVALHPRLALSGHMPEVMASALSYREKDSPCYVPQDFNPRDRGQNPGTYKLSAAFGLVDCKMLEEGQNIYRRAGLAQGYVIGVMMGRRPGGEMVVALFIDFPQATWSKHARYWLRVKVRASYTGLNGPPPTWLGICPSSSRIDLEGCFNTRSWTDVVHDESIFFEGGTVRFDIEVSFPTD